METSRRQKPRFATAVERSERSLMSCVAVFVRSAGDPGGVAGWLERPGCHAAHGFVTSIAPELACGDGVLVSPQAGLAARNRRFRSAGRAKLAASKSDPRRHGAGRASRSGLGIVPATVWTALPTGAGSPSGLQHTGGTLSAGVVDRF
jgi:hypothetical protein